MSREELRAVAEATARFESELQRATVSLRHELRAREEELAEQAASFQQVRGRWGASASAPLPAAGSHLCNFYF